MIKILLSGANGRMGQAISNLVKDRDDCRIIAGVDINDSIEMNIFKSFEKVPANLDIDVIIDFTNPSVFRQLVDFAKAKSLPLVVATTGLSKEDMEYMRLASKELPILYSANMSIGISLMKDLVKKASLFLGQDFDIEIVERHHNQKIDAPSGTALALADAINSVNDNKYDYIYDRQAKREKRQANEIGISSIRGGNIIGDHDIIFAGNNEIIEINHRALSRNIFADGALRAALFIKDKEKGLYSIDDLVKNLN